MMYHGTPHLFEGDDLQPRLATDSFNPDKEDQPYIYASSSLGHALAYAVKPQDSHFLCSAAGGHVYAVMSSEAFASLDQWQGWLYTLPDEGFEKVQGYEHRRATAIHRSDFAVQPVTVEDMLDHNVHFYAHNAQQCSYGDFLDIYRQCPTDVASQQDFFLQMQSCGILIPYRGEKACHTDNAILGHSKQTQEQLLQGCKGK